MSDEPYIELPNVTTHANIGILGGSFDPPHIGHVLLAISFLALESIDELWIIPCSNHVFKSAPTGFEHRLAMCKIAFRHLKQVRILDIESKLKAPSYTIETLNFIAQEKPYLNLQLGIGSDLIRDFSKWHKPEEIVKKTKITIFERISYPIASLPAILNNARIHQGCALPDISSTSLRDCLQKKPKNDVGDLLDQQVLNYIKKHQLYD